MGLFDFFKRKANRYEKADQVEYETAYFDINEDFIENNDMYAIIEPLWWAVNYYDGEETYERDMAQFTLEQRYIFAIALYTAEVNNGGHDQFYFNSSGIVWEDAMRGFEAAGLKKNYEIIKESAERLGGYPSKNRLERQDRLEQYEPDFDDLDSRFYRSEEEDFEDALLRYIRANKEKFVFKGTLKRLKLME